MESSPWYINAVLAFPVPSDVHPGAVASAKIFLRTHSQLVDESSGMDPADKLEVVALLSMGTLFSLGLLSAQFGAAVPPTLMLALMGGAAGAPFAATAAAWAGCFADARAKVARSNKVVDSGDSSGSGSAEELKPPHGQARSKSSSRLVARADGSGYDRVATDEFTGVAP